jgi:hypothetical protein
LAAAGEKEELAVYLESFRSEREAGEKTADAYRVALLGVLTSRHFIYLVEGDPVARERLTDWELASRLSYFLWSSMPDDRPLDRGPSGALNGEVRRTEGRKSTGCCRTVKSNRFIDDFSRQWLQLHRLGMFPPDKKLYPSYDAWLETSLRAEPVEFFRELSRKNLPIDALCRFRLDDGQRRLCDFYGLPEPKTGGFQRVSLKPEDHRGGLLTMGAVLGLTSDGTRHRPVHRGVWVSEAIFNKTPPSTTGERARSNPTRQKPQGHDSPEDRGAPHTTPAVPPAMQDRSAWLCLGSIMTPSGSGERAKSAKGNSVRIP